VSLESGFSQGPPNFAGSKLTIEQTDEISRLGGAIDQAGAAIELPAAVKYKGKSKYTTVAGVSANYGKIRNLKVSTGRGISGADITLSRKVALLGTGISENLFGKGNAVGKDVTIGEEKFSVVGVLEKLGSGGVGFDVDNFVAIPITSGLRLFGMENVMTITIKATSKESVPQAILQTKKYLSRQLKKDDYSVVDQSNLLSTITQILGVLTTALGGIAAISLVVGGVGIMNIMLVSVTERTREIGLRKAVGAKPKDILTQFLIEAVVLSLFGGIIGIIIGIGGAQVINKFFPAAVSFWSVMLSFGVSALVGVLFGVAPAIRASRLNPIDALRYE
ncbi:MAG: FtsX-like permease family protein, partial [Candidatus Curtissbacteria bacterium]|nr:FtsX-like permease family protein [Candidatus Curtissbacteria bacterium]